MISTDRLMYDPIRKTLRKLGSGLILSIPPEENNLPNVYLRAVQETTDTYVKQQFIVKHNDLDYDGIKIILSTKPDEILTTIPKSSDGIYEWNFPIKEKNVTIAYYIYAYKNDINGQYTVKHIYIKDSAPTIPINTLTFRFSSTDVDTETLENIGINGTWTKIENSEYNDWLFTGNECKVLATYDDIYEMFLDFETSGVATVTRVSKDTVNLLFSPTSYYYDNVDLICSMCAAEVNGTYTIDIDSAGNKSVTFIYNEVYEKIELDELSSIESYIDILNGKIDGNVTFEGFDNLVTITDLDATAVTNALSMFEDCSSLTTVSNINISNAVNTASMFEDCSSLTTVSNINISNTVNTTSMFEGCESITVIPTLNVTNCKYFDNIFKNCTEVTTGITEFYNQILETDYISASYAFYHCGINTESGIEVLQNIPVEMGGIILSEIEFKITDSSSIPSDTSNGTFTQLENGNWLWKSYEPIIGAEFYYYRPWQYSDVSVEVVRFNVNAEFTEQYYKRGFFDGCDAIKKLCNININNATCIKDVLSSIKNVENWSEITINAPKATNAVGLLAYNNMTESPAIILPNLKNASSMFKNCDKLTTVNNLNIGTVTDTKEMFYNCSTLQNIGLFDTSLVVNMSNMFYMCKTLETIPNFITNNVQDFTNTFYGCNALTTLPSTFNTSSATTLEGTFEDCYVLSEIPSLNTTNVTTMLGTFRECKAITTVPYMDTHNVTTFGCTFMSCDNLESVPLLDTSNATNLALMFYDCKKLKSVPLFDTKNVTNMMETFYCCHSLKEIPTFDTHNVQIFVRCLADCISLESIPLFDLSSATSIMEICYSYLEKQGCPSVKSGMLELYNKAKDKTQAPNLTDYYYAFKNSGTNNADGMAERAQIPAYWGGDAYASFTFQWETDISQPDDTTNYNIIKIDDKTYKYVLTSAVYDTLSFSYLFSSKPEFKISNNKVQMISTDGGIEGITLTDDMFLYCSSLTAIQNFDTSNVTNMCSMFYGCTSLTTVPELNTINVYTMESMFYGCTSLTNVPLFNTTNVTNMRHMFYGCTSLTNVPLFNTTNVTNMGSMLSNCSTLTTVPLFDTSKVTTMNNMLRNCTALTVIPAFNVANVTDMAYMCYTDANIKSGMLTLYNAANATGKVTTYTKCFDSAGTNTETGMAERAQIPTTWGGDKSA